MPVSDWYFITFQVLLRIIASYLIVPVSDCYIQLFKFWLQCQILRSSSRLLQSIFVLPIANFKVWKISRKKPEVAGCNLLHEFRLEYCNGSFSKLHGTQCKIFTGARSSSQPNKKDRSTQHGVSLQPTKYKVQGASMCAKCALHNPQHSEAQRCSAVNNLNFLGFVTYQVL